MLQIIDQIKNLYNELKNRMDGVSAVEAESKAKLDKAEKVLLDLHGKAVNLEGREKEISKIEDIVKFSEQVKAASVELKKQLDEFAIQKKAFEDYNEIKRKEHKEKEADLTSEFARANSLKADYEKKTLDKLNIDFPGYNIRQIDNHIYIRDYISRIKVDMDVVPNDLKSKKGLMKIFIKSAYIMS